MQLTAVGSSGISRPFHSMSLRRCQESKEPIPPTEHRLSVPYIVPFGQAMKLTVKRPQQFFLLVTPPCLLSTNRPRKGFTAHIPFLSSANGQGSNVSAYVTTNEITAPGSKPTWRYWNKRVGVCKPWSTGLSRSTESSMLGFRGK